MMFYEWFNRGEGENNNNKKKTKKGRKRGYSGLMEFAFNSTCFSFISPNTRI